MELVLKEALRFFKSRGALQADFQRPLAKVSLAVPGALHPAPIINAIGHHLLLTGSVFPNAVKQELRVSPSLDPQHSERQP